MTEAMYVVAVEGQKQREVDLSGVYRMVALANPLDGSPMTLDSRSVVAQMTLPANESLLPTTTRDALHALVWGAASGEVTTYRFPDGPALALTVREGTEYKRPKKEYGAVKAPPAGPRGAYRERRYGPK